MSDSDYCIRCGKKLVTNLDELTGICADCWKPSDYNYKGEVKDFHEIEFG